jgi:hypothetical protein
MGVNVLVSSVLPMTRTSAKDAIYSSIAIIVTLYDSTGIVWRNGTHQ